MKFLGTDGFALIFDNLLGYEPVELKRLLNLYALLYDRLLVSDSWIMTNGSLQTALQEHTGVELLRGGVVVPVRRDTVQSWRDFFEQCQKKNMHGLCATDPYVSFLDSVVPQPQTFSMTTVAASYGFMTGRVLEPDILMSIGISEQSALLVQKILKEGKDAGKDTNNNTFLKEQIQPQLPTHEQELFWLAARSPYQLNLPQVLGSGIVGPKGFQGDKILAALKAHTRGVGEVQILPVNEAPLASAESGVMSSTITNPLICWLFSPAVLEKITPEELAAARSTSEREVYIRALDAEVQQHNPNHWAAYFSAFEKYFTDAATIVFQMWVATGKLGMDPMPGAVLVTSDGAIHIQPPEGHVLMTGVAEKLDVQVPDKMVLVGREVNVVSADSGFPKQQGTPTQPNTPSSSGTPSSTREYDDFSDTPLPPPWQIPPKKDRRKDFPELSIPYSLS